MNEPAIPPAIFQRDGENCPPLLFKKGGKLPCPLGSHSDGRAGGHGAPRKRKGPL